MDLFLDFLIKNFFLLCLTLGVIFMVIKGYRNNKQIVFNPIVVVSLALLLSVVYFVEILTARYPELVFVSTLCLSLGFIIRPIVLLFFIMMTLDNKWVLRGVRVLIIINAIVYLLALFINVPALTHAIFYYENGVAYRGPLFYFCHGIIIIMGTAFVLYSILSLKGRHKGDVMACLVCVFFIVAASILESFLIADYLLNTTIAISCLFYVVYLYQQASIKDALTGLYDRKAYYYDLKKLENRVTGLLIIDMNSLKMINDIEGHHAGDIALQTISEAISNSIDYRCMDAYRMGGDEFIVLSMSNKENILEEVANKIKDYLSDTPYSVAIGYSDRNGLDMHNLTLKADEMMYKDKNLFYQTHNVKKKRDIIA